MASPASWNSLCELWSERSQAFLYVMWCRTLRRMRWAVSWMRWHIRVVLLHGQSPLSEYAGRRAQSETLLRGMPSDVSTFLCSQFAKLVLHDFTPLSEYCLARVAGYTQLPQTRIGQQRYCIVSIAFHSYIAVGRLSMADSLGCLCQG